MDSDSAVEDEFADIESVSNASYMSEDNDVAAPIDSTPSATEDIPNSISSQDDASSKDSHVGPTSTPGSIPTTLQQKVVPLTQSTVSSVVSPSIAEDTFNTPIPCGQQATVNTPLAIDSNDRHMQPSKTPELEAKEKEPKCGAVPVSVK
ncbi:hypothetical protein BGZ67_008853 [Mortierella alpina]|nr:hypothetical protein BGZ67_008853 [Mortierella alpina]